MRQETFPAKTLQAYLKKKRIATLAELKDALGTQSTMTIFRKLKSLEYLTSYSHRGQYYTLGMNPRFNSLGLWSCDSVHFSRYGNLQETTCALVGESEAGYTADELACVVQVDVKHALLRLTRTKHLKREKVGPKWVYFSRRRKEHTHQKHSRKAMLLEGSAIPVTIAATAPEFHAGLLAFFDLLDERQKRLFAGLQATLLGHGGDRSVAALLGMDAHTVAKGRKEVLSGHSFDTTLRKKGGGRKRLEKKDQKS